MPNTGKIDQFVLQMCQKKRFEWNYDFQSALLNCELLKIRLLYYYEILWNYSSD